MAWSESPTGVCEHGKGTEEIPGNLGGPSSSSPHIRAQDDTGSPIPRLRDATRANGPLIASEARQGKGRGRDRDHQRWGNDSFTKLGRFDLEGARKFEIICLRQAAND